MELKKVIQWLLDNKYGLIVGNQFVVTNKLQSEVFGVAPVGSIPDAINKVVAAVAPMVKVSTVDEKKTIWNEFIERANIPHRVKATDGGTYTVRQYSPSAVLKLIQIIKTPGIEYNRLVESTKNYYATVSYKALLSNYLLKDIWKDEYDNYKPNSSASLNDGSNRWES